MICFVAFLSSWTWVHQNIFFWQSKPSSYKGIFLIVAKENKISPYNYNTIITSIPLSLFCLPGFCPYWWDTYFSTQALKTLPRVLFCFLAYCTEPLFFILHLLYDRVQSRRKISPCAFRNSGLWLTNSIASPRYVPPGFNLFFAPWFSNYVPTSVIGWLNCCCVEQSRLRVAWSEGEKRQMWERGYT